MQQHSLTVPRSSEELLDAEWLHGALDDIGDDETIVSVERAGTSKTRAEKLRFSVTVDGRDGRRVGAYCAKAHLDGTVSGITEALFYRDLAPRLDVRMPRVHYAGIDGESAIIIMEDVVAADGEFMSPLRPLSVSVVRSTLSQLARLHASTMGEHVDVDWLTHGSALYGDFEAGWLHELLADGRAEGFAPELRDGANLVAALERHVALGTTCVLHGDTHTGNVYLDARGRGCWFDWEVVQTGHWVQDVAYHLASALSIDDRRQHEAELLRHYLLEVEGHGAAAPTFDEAWELYRRGFSYGYLLWVITMIRSRDEVLAHMPRIATAMTDHGTYRLLGVI